MPGWFTLIGTGLDPKENHSHGLKQPSLFNNIFNNKARKDRDRNVNIRLAKENDIPRIMDLLLQVHKVHSDARPDIFTPGETKYTPSELSLIIQDKHRPIFVAEDEDGIVQGYCFCIYEITQGEHSLTDRKVLYIDDLCVEEKKRGTHIASSLCRFVTEFAKNEGFDSITLNVWNFNESAARFYDYMGFTPLKTVMELPL